MLGFRNLQEKLKNDFFLTYDNFFSNLKINFIYTSNSILIIYDEKVMIIFG